MCCPCSCPLSPAVSKASAGVMEMMPVYTVSHLQNFLASAREDGWCILSTAASNSCPEERGKVVVEDRGRGRSKERNKIIRTKTVDCQDFVKSAPTLLVLGNWIVDLYFKQLFFYSLPPPKIFYSYFAGLELLLFFFLFFYYVFLFKFFFSVFGCLL